MLKNKEKVLAKLETIRSNLQDYFIPLGGSDHDTTAKKEISNLAMTLRHHLQTVDAVWGKCSVRRGLILSSRS